jgi:hypothetical protein
MENVGHSARLAQADCAAQLSARKRREQSAGADCLARPAKREQAVQEGEFA